MVDLAGGAVEGPVFVVEVAEVVIDIGRLFHGELEEALLAVMIYDEGEVAVGKKFVGYFLDLPFFEMLPCFLVGHVEGDDVAHADVLREFFAGAKALEF